MEYVYIIDKCNRRNFYLYDIMISEHKQVLEYSNEPIPLNANQIPVYIFAPSKILTADEINAMNPNSIVFGGNNYPIEIVSSKGIKYRNIMKDELYTYYNSRITAEGTLQLAMKHTDTALYACYVLVLGYGRLGRAVASIFENLCKGVSVATYSASEFSSSCSKYVSYFERTYTENMSAYPIIINTIPSMVINSQDIKFIQDECLFIDLASVPGLDTSGLAGRNINYLPALGLPDKTAPFSAAYELNKAIARSLD